MWWSMAACLHPHMEPVTAVSLARIAVEEAHGWGDDPRARFEAESFDQGAWTVLAAPPAGEGDPLVVVVGPTWVDLYREVTVTAR